MKIVSITRKALIDLFDIFPATHGMGALQAVLCYGASPSQIGFRSNPF